VTEPLVSVVIAAYNAAQFLPETLDSVFAQTYGSLEVIVVDDGSTDGTRTLLEAYPPRIRLIRQAHGGLAAARNAGLRAANGDFIALLDADDLWLPEKIAVQVEVARRHPEAGMIVCDGVEFEGETIIRRLFSGFAAGAFDRTKDSEITGHFFRTFIERTQIACPAQTLLPRHVVEQIGPFGDYSCQDFDYYLRVTKRLPATFHRHSLVRWRYRPSSMSGSRERRALFWSLQALPVLRAHAELANAEDCSFILRQILCNKAQAAYHYGVINGRLKGTSLMADLWSRNSWTPTVLPYFVAIWIPRPLIPVFDWIYQRWRRLFSRVV
jgi:glycosyltransferase involved in cell wall biosynthesis